jgi:hypothetical protein
MPLFAGALALIRANLEDIQRGNRARLVAIGTLTAVQLEAINRQRSTGGYPPIVDEVVFIGSHIYNSRVGRDGYAIDDVLDQIASAMEAASVVRPDSAMTAMEIPVSREDRYGNRVLDRVVFECTARYPRPELYSVMPKGDRIKPKRPPIG